MLRKKTNSSFAVKLLKEKTIHFYCLSDESRFSDTYTIMELDELNWLCKHMKTSEAANLVLHWIFVLNSVKEKLLHVSIVKELSWTINSSISITVILTFEL